MSRTFHIVTRFGLFFVVLLPVAHAADYLLLGWNLPVENHRYLADSIYIFALGISVDLASRSSRRAAFFPDQPSPFAERSSRVNVSANLPAASGIAVVTMIIGVAVQVLKHWFLEDAPFVSWWKFPVLGGLTLFFALAVLSTPAFGNRGRQ